MLQHRIVPVLLCLLPAVHGAVKTYGHPEVRLGDQLYYTYDNTDAGKLVIPDVTQRFPADGKLMNVSFRSETHGEGFLKVVVLRPESGGTAARVVQIPQWTAGKLKYENNVPWTDPIPHWKTIVFTDGYLKVEKGDFIGFVPDENSLISFKEEALGSCDGGVVYPASTLNHGIGSRIHLTPQSPTVCHTYGYTAAFLEQDSCMDIELTYTYHTPNNEYQPGAEIGGYNIMPINQGIIGSDSICWDIVAPIRDDGRAAVVVLDTTTLPWGYEVHGELPEEPEVYCVGGGLKLIDGHTGKLFRVVCKDTVVKTFSVYSSTNWLRLVLHSDRPATLAGEVYGGLRSDGESMGAYDFTNKNKKNKLLIYILVPLAALLVIILVASAICACARKRRKAQGQQQAGHQEAPATAMGSYPRQEQAAVPSGVKGQPLDAGPPPVGYAPPPNLYSPAPGPIGGPGAGPSAPPMELPPSYDEAIS